MTVTGVAPPPIAATVAPAGFANVADVAGVAAVLSTTAAPAGVVDGGAARSPAVQSDTAAAAVVARLGQPVVRAGMPLEMWLQAALAVSDETTVPAEIATMDRQSPAAALAALWSVASVEVLPVLLQPLPTP